MSSFDFSNTEVSFAGRSAADLRRAKWLFSTFNYPWIVKYGPAWSMSLMKIPVVGWPVKALIRGTIFRHFCGGEDIAECSRTTEWLWKYKVGTILDYSVEGEDDEQVFIETSEEIKRTIDKAAGNPAIPFSVFKTTGMIRFGLLEKVSAGEKLNDAEQAEWETAVKRVDAVCGHAAAKKVRIFIDAEETWIQKAIDDLATDMMKKYNTTECIVYNTLQMYRHDRLAYLKQIIAETGCKLGFKLVRGAYMEKERLRAAEMGYPSPIQPDKESTDRDFDEALKVCMAHIDRVNICAGTHNENSSILLAKLMEEKGIGKDDERIYFSQLLGMSDNISFNLSAAGYRVAKYVPYGPVAAVLPYLARRAQENSAVAGQMGRELAMINKEIRRRKA